MEKEEQIEIKKQETSARETVKGIDIVDQRKNEVSHSPYGEISEPVSALGGLEHMIADNIKVKRPKRLMYSDLPSSADEMDDDKKPSLPVSAGRQTMLSQQPVMGSSSKYTNEVSYEPHKARLSADFTQQDQPKKSLALRKDIRHRVRSS